MKEYQQYPYRGKEEKWLSWAKKMQSLAQQGLTYTKDKYELDRYQQLRDLSVEVMQDYTGVDKKKIEDMFCFEYGYQTPKSDVRGAILRNEEVLLVHEQIDGKWAMPGGWADIGYSVTESIIKEAREEAGAVVEPYKLVGIFDWASDTQRPIPYGIYKTVMLCELKEFCFEKNMETAGARFFNRYELPELSPGRTTQHLIDICFQARDTQNWLPIVD